MVNVIRFRLEINLYICITMFRVYFMLLMMFLVSGCKKTLQLKHPESIACTEEFIYVSNVNGDPAEKDKNGFISKLYKNGTVSENDFIRNLDAPKGLCLVDNTLFVTDLDRVLGFNILSKKQAYTFDFSWFKTQFLNDICWDGYNTLYVSSTDLNEIFSIDLSDLKISSLNLKDSLSGSNGLCYHDSILYVVEMGNDSIKGGLAQVSFKNKQATFSRILNHTGILDGLFYWQEKLYFSDWQTNGNTTKAQIHVFDLQTKTLSNFPLDKSYNGIADITYDSLHHRIIAPNMEENKLEFWKLY